MVASLGVPVGKMSGQGFSFSGDTLDKLEAIPGFNVNLTLDQFKRQLREVGVVVAGRTPRNWPRPTASSTGCSRRHRHGALPAADRQLDHVEEARSRRRRHRAGRQSRAPRVHGDVRGSDQAGGADRRSAGPQDHCIDRRYDQPLGLAVGNSLEVIEAIETLGARSRRLPGALHPGVAAEMLLIAGAVATPEDGQRRAATTLSDGSAWTKSRQFVAAEGGDLRAIDEPARLPRAPLIAPVSAVTPGRRVRSATGAGAGRRSGKERRRGRSGGGVVLAERCKVGTHIEAGEPLLWVHAHTSEALAAALARLGRAYSITDEPSRRSGDRSDHRTTGISSPEKAVGPNVTISEHDTGERQQS